MVSAITQRQGTACQRLFRESCAGQQPAALPESREAANLRNITVPVVSGADGGNVELAAQRAALSARGDWGRRHGRSRFVFDNDIGRTVAKSSSSMANRARRGPTSSKRSAPSASWKHPNIVPIHDVGTTPRPAFVMKHIDGETRVDHRQARRWRSRVMRLWHHRRPRRNLPLGLLHACSAHNKDIVHRDIKPANVMVGRFGEVVLMDWGSLSLADERRDRCPLCRRSKIVGTPPTCRPSRPAATTSRSMPAAIRTAPACCSTSSRGAPLPVPPAGTRPAFPRSATGWG